MGRKKEGIHDTIREGRDRGDDAIAEGSQLDDESREIRGILDSIDPTMDEDDVTAVADAQSGYKSDFSDAFDGSVEPAKDGAIEIERDAADRAGEEQERVRGSADRFSQMERVSDVGSGNARTGADRMRQSADEYQRQIDTAEETADDIERQISELGASVKGQFD